MHKPYSEACERNKLPILEVLNRIFAGQKNILEIGSGTGQHAVFFAEKLPYLSWQTSDLEINHNGIKAWLGEINKPNLKLPLELDVGKYDWESSDIYDAVFTANTFHIMSWEDVRLTLENVGKIIKKEGYFCVYGPFNYQGKFTSTSNQTFDMALRSRDPLSGIREFEQVCSHAEAGDLKLTEDNAMPANNRLLVFQKQI